MLLFSALFLADPAAANPDPEPPAEQQQRVQLNFQDVPVSAAMLWASGWLDREVVVAGAAVDAQITVYAHAPVSPALAGLTAVVSEGLITILPATDSAPIGGTVVVFPVEFAEASELAQILSEIFAQSASVVGFTPDNALIFGGSDVQISQVRRLLTQYDL